MGSITAAKCECGQITIPPKKRCIFCNGKTSEIKIDNTGKILTYTLLHATPEGFDAPLLLGLIELDGVRDTLNLPPPKILCAGQIPEAELEMDLKVKVMEKNNKYYFHK